jgi:hypothetical protein
MRYVASWIIGLCAACSPNLGPPGGSGPTEPICWECPPTSDQSHVAIQDFAFAPETIAMGPARWVIWGNQGQSQHTSTSDDGLWDSGQISSNGTYKRWFPGEGTYHYHCSNHPQMTGTIVVVSYGQGVDPVVIVKAPTASGDGQTGTVGTALPNVLRVRVSQGFALLQGDTVTWSASDTGASVNPTKSVTDGSGIATTTWILGRAVGAQTATATLSGATGSPATFTATATPSP